MDKRVICGVAVTVLMSLLGLANVVEGKSNPSAHTADKPRDVANKVDQQILAELQKAGVKVADRCSDEDFLRRASLDIIGQLPTPADVIAFRNDTDAEKRTKLIDKLIDSPDFGVNWSRYWRDVIYIRSTEQRARLNQEEFEIWMAHQWNKGIGWNSTVSAMLTAQGNVQEHPETALIFAQGAVAEEVAAEACRIFLGIQLQCANCHDHPSDVWKREQFHQLAAYFPRISERRLPDEKTMFEIVSVNTDRKQGEFMRENPEMFVRRFDRNRDHMVSKDELTAGPTKMGGRPGGKKPAKKTMAKEDRLPPKVIERLFEYGDTNKDGMLTVDEIKNMPAPNNSRRGSTEHHMVDLQNPTAEGKLIDPKFFVDGSALPHGRDDEDRRRAVAHAFTSPDNPWFAKAFVNRMWAEMLGEGFYMPIDDLGPTRTARYPEVLDDLCKNFVASGYDPKWLFRTIANTEAYQRKIQSKPASESELPFASATPVPLRSDIIFSSLIQVFGTTEAEMGRGAPKPKDLAKLKDTDKSKEMDESGDMKVMKEKADKPKAYRQQPRFVFDILFGTDPSTPKDEVTGNIPQSLMMMNSRRFRAGMSANGDTRLGRILKENKKNEDALKNLYLLVLAREPSAHEVEICSQYIAEVNKRPEAFEDLMWSLLNSSEFISRR